MAQLRFLLQYVNRNQRFVVVGLLLSVAGMGCQLSLPWMIKFLIDKVLLGRESGQLTRSCVLVALFASGAFLFGVAERQVFRYLGVLATTQLREDLARQMHALPLGWFHERHSGQLISLFANDVSTVSRFCSSTLREALYSTVRLVTTLVLLLAVFKEMALFAVLSASIYLVLALPFTRPIRRAAVVLQRCLSATITCLHESAAAVRDIRAFGRQQFHIEILKKQFRSAIAPELRLALLQESASFTYVAFWSTVALVYWFAGQRILSGGMTIGLLGALISYANMLQEPIARLASINGELQASLASGEALRAFLAIPVEVSTGGQSPITECQGMIEFDRVCFSYPTGALTLRDVSFSLHPGERVAIVGPSGAGKSTLASLCLRLHEPTSGRILLDGRAIDRLDATSLRRHIAIVFQDTFLLSSTLRENLTFGMASITDRELVCAAQAANAHSFISRLPEGYDTLVGERGVKLSAGQKQRLGIARAVLRNPRILILDEATSALDSVSELAILEALDRLMIGRSTLVIAHRLSTVAKADRILILDGGRIAACGTHRQLIESCSLYKRLYELQHDHASESPALFSGER